MRLISAAAVLLACLIGTGCISCSTRQNPDELREKTAQTTAELKSDAKAIAQGVHEGLKRNETVGLNSARKEKLTQLPGINDDRADKIVAGRPYKTTHELVTRHIVSEEEYGQIKSRVTVQ